MNDLLRAMHKVHEANEQHKLKFANHVVYDNPRRPDPRVISPMKNNTGRVNNNIPTPQLQQQKQNQQLAQKNSRIGLTKVQQSRQTGQKVDSWVSDSQLTGNRAPSAEDVESRTHWHCSLTGNYNASNAYSSYSANIASIVSNANSSNSSANSSNSANSTNSGNSKN